ncbi:MAG: helix-turn-helix domain-containing protein [Eubacteriales bacterium]|nr:helix-turn-helix domain-containing protein [Eubacteriales bacterium]
MSEIKKYSNKLKYQAVKEYLDGQGTYRSIAEKYGIPNDSLVSRWVNQYQTFGEEGLFRPRTNKRYPVELKLKAVKLHETTELTQREIANMLKIKNEAILSVWGKAYREEGVAGLQKRVGRPKMKTKADHPSPKDLEDKALERGKDKRIRELEYELRLAHIKNEYLEMLRSLGQKEAKTKQESSTNSGTNTN